MFKLEPNPSFWAKADIHVPGEGMAAIKVQYRYLNKDERTAYYGSLAEKTNLEALSEIMLDWGEIDAPFSKDNLARLLDEYPGSALALYQAYKNEILGTTKEPGAAEKN